MRQYLFVLGLGLVACGGSSSTPVGAGNTLPDGGSGDPLGTPFTGDVNASQCGNARPDLAPARCIAPAGVPLFAFASCRDLGTDNTLTVAGALAVGGKTRTSSPLHVSGAFTSLGAIEASNTQDIDGELRTGGDFTSAAPIHVGADAYVGGSLDAKNSFEVKGVLHLADGDVSKEVTAGGGVMRGPVSVAPPLACDRAPDLARFVADAAANENDGHLAGGDSLAAVKEPTNAALGCGRYVFSKFDIGNQTTLRIAGNTVIVVQGDLHISAPLRIELAAGASLDLVIGGSLSVDNTFDITSSDTGTNKRAWIGVAGRITIAAPMRLAGWLVAPRGDLAVNNTLDVGGAAYVGSAHVASPMITSAGGSVAGDGCIAP